MSKSTSAGADGLPNSRTGEGFPGKAFRPKFNYFPPEIVNFGLIRLGTY
jgi:hypothetical protein